MGLFGHEVISRIEKDGIKISLDAQKLIIPLSGDQEPGFLIIQVAMPEITDRISGADVLVLQPGTEE